MTGHAVPDPCNDIQSNPTCILPSKWAYFGDALYSYDALIQRCRGASYVRRPGQLARLDTDHRGRRSDDAKLGYYRAVRHPAVLGDLVPLTQSIDSALAEYPD